MFIFLERGERERIKKYFVRAFCHIANGEFKIGFADRNAVDEKFVRVAFALPKIFAAECGAVIKFDLRAVN